MSKQQWMKEEDQEGEKAGKAERQDRGATWMN